jgi:hypothetical protein
MGLVTFSFLLVRHDRALVLTFLVSVSLGTKKCRTRHKVMYMRCRV